MIRYVVTTWAGREEVNLSKLGHWGNRRYPNAAAAREAARFDAGSDAFTITQEPSRRKPEDL